MKKERNQKGFTLVELAIVMVIIGLLIGAVLKGQSMIDDAKQKRLMNDVQGISAAFYTYFDKYNAIPGDDASANARWAGVADGNGDGYIGGTAVATPTGESLAAWQALRSAGLISGDPATTGAAALSSHPFGGKYGISYRSFGAAIGTKNYIYIYNIAGSIGQLIDTKFDDGVWNTGSVQASAVYTTATISVYYAL